MSVLDIVVICVLSIFAIIGFFKGFLNTLLSLFGNLASLAIAIVIVKPCAKFLDSIFHIANWLGNLLIKGVQNANVLPDLSSTTMTADEVIAYLKSSNGFIGKLSSLFVDKNIALYGNGEANLISTLTNNMGSFACLVFTVIILFILIRIAVLLLSKLFNAITKNHSFGALDRCVGLAFGLIKGSLYVTGILAVIYALSPIFTGLDGLIQNSPFTNWLYGYVNQLINWVVSSINFQSLFQIK